jgi:hypothetical protein
VKSKVIVLYIAIIALIAVLFFMASCAEKRLPPTIAPIPTNTFANTKTITPTRTPTPSITVTRTVTCTFTVTVTVTPVQIFYHFDSDLEGWATNYVDMAFTSINQTTDAGAPKVSGPGSVSITTAFGGNSGGNTAGGFAVGTSGNPPDLTGKTYTVNIWLPSSMVGQDYSVDLYIWDASWTEQKVTFSLLSGYTGDAWNVFTYSPAIPGINTVMMLGVRITQNAGAPDVSDNVYIDEISIL